MSAASGSTPTTVIDDGPGIATYLGRIGSHKPGLTDVMVQNAINEIRNDCTGLGVEKPFNTWESNIETEYVFSKAAGKDVLLQTVWVKALLNAGYDFNASTPTTPKNPSSSNNLHVIPSGGGPQNPAAGSASTQNPTAPQQQTVGGGAKASGGTPVVITDRHSEDYYGFKEMFSQAFAALFDTLFAWPMQFVYMAAFRVINAAASEAAGIAAYTVSAPARMVGIYPTWSEAMYQRSKNLSGTLPLILENLPTYALLYTRRLLGANVENALLRNDVDARKNFLNSAPIKAADIGGPIVSGVVQNITMNLAAGVGNLLRGNAGKPGYKLGDGVKRMMLATGDIGDGDQGETPRGLAWSFIDLLSPSKWPGMSLLTQITREATGVQSLTYGNQQHGIPGVLDYIYQNMEEALEANLAMRFRKIYNKPDDEFAVSAGPLTFARGSAVAGLVTAATAGILDLGLNLGNIVATHARNRLRGAKPGSPAHIKVQKTNYFFDRWMPKSLAPSQSQGQGSGKASNQAQGQGQRPAQASGPANSLTTNNTTVVPLPKLPPNNPSGNIQSVSMGQLSPSARLDARLDAAGLPLARNNSAVTLTGHRRSGRGFFPFAYKRPERTEQFRKTVTASLTQVQQPDGGATVQTPPNAMIGRTSQ